MGYESEMYHELQHDIKPRLAAIEKALGLNQPPIPAKETEKVESVVEGAGAPDTATGNEGNPEDKKE